MKPIDWIFAIIEGIFWYAALYTFLYSIKNPVDLYRSTLVILIFAYMAFSVCPLIRHMPAWKQMWKE